MVATTERSLESLGAVANRIREAARDDKVSVGELLEALGPRSFVPLLLVPALIAATPLSGIPGVSIVAGLLIALISFEMLMSYDEAYVPRRLKRSSIDADALRRALAKAQPVIAWFDRHTHSRLSWMFHRPMVYLPKVICLLSGLAMPFLEFIPFTSSILAIGVSLLAIALLTRDGLFLLLAIVPYGGALFVALRLA